MATGFLTRCRHLTDFAQIRSKDRIRLHVLTVDHPKGSLVGEWVQTLPPNPEP